MNKPKFKVGDVITGTADNKYGLTNSRGVYKVTQVGDSTIKVIVLEHEDFGAYGKDTEYTWLKIEYFEHLPLYKSPLYLAMNEEENDG